MISDLRYAIRSLGKSPGFSLVAVLTLALGIGANTAIFSVINAALLQPLAYEEPDQLVQFWSKPPGLTEPIPLVTEPQFEQWRDHATAFSAIAIDGDGLPGTTTRNLIEHGRAERITGAAVTANYLDLLRVAPFIGRSFEMNADQVGGPNHVVILSHEWWQTRFGSEPSIVGRTINLNGDPFEVIGVLPPNALVQDDVNFLLPLVLEAPENAWRRSPTNPWARVTARLRPGVTVAQAEAEANALSEEYYSTIPHPPHLPFKIFVKPMQDGFVQGPRPSLLILFGAVSLVLLIACANVANLMLVRANRRQKEMAVRTALGASARRLLRLVLTESLVLSILGAVVGVMAAGFGIDALTRASAGFLPDMLQPTLDLPVLGFSLVLACGCGMLFGILPARSACRLDVNRDLKEAVRGSTAAGRPRAQSLLIISEVALTVMLLIATGLLLRSFARVLAADPGFDAHRALVCDVSLTPKNFATTESLLEFERQVVRRIEAVPGVEAVGTASTLPLSNTTWGERVGLPGQTEDEPSVLSVRDYVGGDYFRAMGINLLQGRLFTPTDNTPDAAPVVVINDRLAAKLLPGVNPVGKSVRLFLDNSTCEVVGVVGSVRHRQIDETADFHLYLPQARDPWTLSLIVRTRIAPLSLVDDVRAAMAAIDPDQALANFRTLEEVVSGSMQQRRVVLKLLGLFAVVATGLACLGLYGVIAYSTQLREREFGVRLALGATASALVRQVLRDSARLVLAGIALGLAGALVGGRILSSLLYEVRAHDPTVFITVPILLVLVAAFACWLPARRTTRINPVAALRAE